MLAMKIREWNKIKGFSYENSKQIKILQYADDCMLFVNDIDRWITHIYVCNKTFRTCFRVEAKYI